MIEKRRGFQSSADARAGRARGHVKAKQFALIIGMPGDYSNDQKAKKDVIDPSGDSHSLKSGRKKWQLFLYSYSRIDSDVGFRALNGMSKFLKNLLNAFPDNYIEYITNKQVAKLKLQKAQLALAKKLKSDESVLQGFLSKSLFNANEVDYLTIYGEVDEKYHVFRNVDVVNTLAKSVTVTNSKARNKNQIDALKTIFKLNDKNLAELEVRTEENHYKEIRFNMYVYALELLKTIDGRPKICFAGKVLVYGSAKRTFPRW